jgi:hypothetical protein
MPARVQGLLIGLGSNKQPNISTISPTFNTLLKLNNTIPYLDAETETDEDEIGKGNEWISPTGVFKTAKVPKNGTIEKYGSAEFMNWGLAYALGDVQVASHVYTMHFTDPGVTVQDPYFSLVAQLAEGGGMAIDEAQLGLVMESFNINFKYGPNRASVKCTADYVGSGISTLPSGVVLPTTLPEEYMLSSAMSSIVINGVDYIAASTALEGSFSIKKNVITQLGYYPGSGQDSDGFAVAGREFYGKRTYGFSFTAFLDHDSTEYAKLVAQTVGTATIKFQVDATHYCQLFMPTVSYQAVHRTDVEGFACVQVVVAPRYDPTVVSGKPNGVLVVTGRAGTLDTFAQ